MPLELKVNGSTVPFGIHFGTVAKDVTPLPELSFELKFAGGFSSGTVYSVVFTGDSQFFPSGLASTPFTLTLGGSEIFLIQLDTSTAGSFTGDMTITHSGANSPLVFSLDAEVTSVGTLKTITVDPTTWDFGTVESGEDSDEKLFTISNVGEAVVDINAPTFTSPFAAGATVPTYPYTLDPGTSVEFGVKFSPVTEGLITEEDGVIVNSTADDPTYPVALSGTGVLVTPVNPVTGVYDFVAATRTLGETLTYEADQEDLNAEEDSTVSKLGNLDEPGVKKSSYAVDFKYEDFGECTVIVTLSTLSEAKSITMTIGTVGGVGQVRQATALPLEVEGELIKLIIDRVGGDGPLSIIDYFIRYERWTARLGTAPIPASVTPVRIVTLDNLEFIVATSEVDERILEVDNQRNATCAIAEIGTPSDIECPVEEVVPPEPEPEPPDDGLFTGVIPLSFLHTEVFDDDINTNYNGSNELWVDTDKYPNITKVVFAANLDSTFSGNPKTVVLKDDGGNTIGTTTVGDGVNNTLARDEAVVLLDGNHRYSFEYQGDPGDEGGLVAEDFQLLIYQENAARTRVQKILLCSHNQSSGGFAGSEALNNYYAYCQTYGGDAYGFGPFVNPPGTQGTENFYHDLFLYEADKWATITNVDFETIGYYRHGSPEGTPCACGASGKVCIFDDTSNAQMVAAEQIYDSDDDVFPTRKLTSLDISEFTDGHEYHLRAHQDRNSVPDPCELRLSRAALYFDLDCTASQKAQIWHRVMSDRGTSASTRDEVRYLHEPSKYPIDTKFFVEATGRHNASTGTLNLVDAGTNDTGTAGSDVADSTLTLTTTYSRQRSIELTTLVDGNRYISKIAGSIGTRHGNMYVLVEIPDA